MTSPKIHEQTPVHWVSPGRPAPRRRCFLTACTALLLYVAVEPAEGFKPFPCQFYIGGIDQARLAGSARGAPQLPAVEHCHDLVDVDFQRLGCLFNREVVMVAAGHISLPIG